MPMPRPDSRISSSVLSAWTLAACSPRSTGMEPTDSKKAFMTLPLTPPVVKYSALAKNATGRGIRACTITLSRNDRWLGATMNGPSLGTFSSPMTVGRQVPEISVRVVQRIASNNAIVLHLTQGCGPDGVHAVNRGGEVRGGMHNRDGTRFVELAVGGKSPADADAVKAIGHGAGYVLGSVADYHGVLGA